jgi:hypothetical protein
VFTNIRTVLHTLVLGRMVFRKERGLRHLQMVLDLKEDTQKASKKVLESMNGAMARSIKDNGPKM